MGRPRRGASAGLDTLAGEDQLSTDDLRWGDRDTSALLAHLAGRATLGVDVTTGNVSPWNGGDVLGAVGFQPLDDEVRARVVSLSRAPRPDAHLRTRRSPSPRRQALTEREQQVLRLVGKGLTTPVISRQLGLAASTVESHVKTARVKLGAASRTHAAALAVTADESRGGSLRRRACGPGQRAPADCNLDLDQRRLLAALSGGLSVQEAARRVHMSLRTAQRRLQSARLALGVRTNRAAAVAFARVHDGANWG